MERIYTIPLRREFSKAANYKRTAKAIKTVRAFVQKHMKCENVKLGRELNLELWKHGRKNPPPRIKVKVLKGKYKDEEIVLINLPNIKIEMPTDKKKKKKEEKTEVNLEGMDDPQKEQDKEKKEVLGHREPKKEELKQPEKPLKVDMKPREKRVIGRTSKK